MMRNRLHKGAAKYRTIKTDLYRYTKYYSNRNSFAIDIGTANTVIENQDLETGRISLMSHH